METYDFTPLFRSTVGFDRLFEKVESSVRPDWPPYTGQKKSEPKCQEMLHQGLASCSFKRTFNLAEHVKSSSADLKNGLLLVELVASSPSS